MYSIRVIDFATCGAIQEQSYCHEDDDRLWDGRVRLLVAICAAIVAGPTVRIKSEGHPVYCHYCGGVLANVFKSGSKMP